MDGTLMTSWEEHDGALQQVLARAERTLCIFDEDLVQLKLERPDTIALVQHFLAADRGNRLHIVVRDAAPLRARSPRLWRLLATYPQNLLIVECAPALAELSEALVIADARHALVRFHKDHARAKCLLDAAHECAPYVRRFDEIVAEGGDEIRATTLGL